MHADNQLLCSLCGPKRSHAFILQASNATTKFSSRSVVQLLQLHPKITPEMISGQKSKIYLGGVPQTPTRYTTYTLIAY